MKSKILISTGGSGGHVIPAITMHDHLKENYDILISSDVRGLKYLDDKFYNTLVIDTPKLNNFILLPLSILKVFFLTLRSLILLKKKRNKNSYFYRWIYVTTFMYSCKNIKH